MRTKLDFVAFAAWLLPVVAAAQTLGTAFTYQGQLTLAGSSLDDTADFQFSLWDAAGTGCPPAGGTQLGATQAVSNVTVADGLFTVQLNGGGEFGTSAFNGTARWLQIAVRSPAGGGAFSTLCPRQPLTPAPYALALPGLYTEQNATSPNILGGHTDNTVTPGVVGAVIAGGGLLDDGAGLPERNSVTDDYGVVGGGRGNRAGDAATSDAPYATVGGGAENTASGESSTVGGGEGNVASDFYSTVGGGGFNAASGASTVGGGSNNAASNGSTIGGGIDNAASGGGSTIGGGSNNDASGASSTVGGGEFNTATGDYSTVGGGVNNAASGGGTVGGGIDNAASGGTVGGGIDNAASGGGTIGGGSHNAASDYGSTVGGGSNNDASGEGSTIGGGYNNTASGWDSTIGGGQYNAASGWYSTVGGGQFNAAWGDSSTVGGGDSNVAWIGSTVGGGTQNAASGGGSTVGGGNYNTASGFASTVGGGYNNWASGDYNSTVGGGFGNFASMDFSTIGGGHGNFAGSDSSTVGGGSENAAYGDEATVGGGYLNYASGQNSTVGGGDSNAASGDASTVGGGDSNEAVGVSSTIGGGIRNAASGDFSTVGGGTVNHAIGDHSTVPGGWANHSGGFYSFAAGRRAKVRDAAAVGGGDTDGDEGAFVWADSTDADFQSTGPNQFLIRAGGGVGIGRTTLANALELEGDASKTAAGDWLANSDARIKTDVQTVTHALETLEKVRLVEFRYTYEYRAAHPTVKDRPYLNVIAQEFGAVFPNYVKSSGDTMPDGSRILQADTYPLTIYSAAAVQELNQKLREKDRQIAELRGRLERLEKMIANQSQSRANGGAQ